jgi:alkanesulfonate monooxygenase SsuD/methylene tetrahydromethanopterin reductase-like flavin-dependent oxidoreductase (luciferase family)
MVAPTMGAEDLFMTESKTRVSYLMSRLEASSSAGVRRAVEYAEDADLDGLGLGDHVSFRVGAGADGLVGAASVLAASDRLRAVVGVYLLPLRHPVLVARQITDISTLAPGRLVLGVGIGGEDPHEFEICGVDPRTRGRRMDECLQVLRALLPGEPVDFDGEFFRLENASIRPGLAAPVPILIGGRSDAAIRRAGQLGDGWFGIWVSSSRYAQAIEQMEHAASAAGREQVSWHNALNVWCGVGSDRTDARGYVASAMEQFYKVPYERFEKWSPAGSPEQIAEFLAPYVDAGCHTFNVIACGESLEAEITAVGEIRKRLR